MDFDLRVDQRFHKQFHVYKYTSENEKKKKKKTTREKTKKKLYRIVAIINETEM